MILVSYIRQLRDKGVPLDEAVNQAARPRLRPVLMTTLVASLGFVPMAFSTGMGAEVQRPLATVVSGGVVSAMVMSLLVGRVLYIVGASGVGVMRMEAGLDTGPVALEARLPIGPGMTAGALHDALMPLGADLMSRALAGLESRGSA